MVELNTPVEQKLPGGAIAVCVILLVLVLAGICAIVLGYLKQKGIVKFGKKE